MEDKVFFANFNSGSYDVKSSRTYCNYGDYAKGIYSLKLVYSFLHRWEVRFFS